MILRDNENIEDLRFRPAAMVKNFEPKTRRRFKGITKAIFKYGHKQLAKAEREMDPVKGENVDIVVRWALNLAATRIFGTIKHWPATSMRGVHAEEPREDERPANGLRREGKAALNRRYIGSVHKFHRWLYEGGGESGQRGGHNSGTLRIRPPQLHGRSGHGGTSRPVPEGRRILEGPVAE
jgi:hypothetical protein